MTHKIDPEWSRQICEDYKIMNLKEVVLKHNLNKGSILYHVRKSGQLTKQGRNRALPYTEIIALYQTGVSGPELADKYKVSYQYIYRLLARNNIPIDQSRTMQGRYVGEKSPTWKPDSESTYRVVHKSVRLLLNKGTCSKCDKSNLEGRQIHTANLNGIYDRNPENYLMMCVPCHRKFDKERRKQLIR